MFQFKTFRILAVIFCLGLGAAATIASEATAQEAPAPAAEEDEEKKLDQIVVEGKSYDDLPPLPKGEIELSPELISRVNDEKGRPALHAYYEFVFDPVIVNANGSLQLDPDPRRSREVLRPQLKQNRSRTGSHIKRIPPSFYKLTLEEGFYALTQINYRIQTRTPIILDPEDPGGVIDAEIDRSLDIFQYCLADGTLLFDVTADTKATLGKIMIRGMGRDKDAYAGHKPIAATGAPTTRPADGFIFAKDPDPVAWGIGYFDAETMCQGQRDKQFVTSGWALDDSWVW